MTNSGRKLRRTFDEVAELYERARPGYPPQLFEDLVTLARLRPAAEILEIGCGTGQATVELARRGFRVLCVELGENLAAIARRKLEPFPQARVLTAAFESWSPGELRFDLVLAATSWHWLDPELRCARAAAALRPGGALAIAAGGHVVPEDGDPFFHEIQDVYQAIGEAEPHWRPPRPDERQDHREELEDCGLFTTLDSRRYLTESTYTAEQYVDLLETFSGHRTIDPARRQVLYRAIGERLGRRPAGTVRYHTLVTLTVARR